MDILERILFLNPDARPVCWDNDHSKTTYDPSHVGLKPSLAELEAVDQAELDVVHYSKRRKQSRTDGGYGTTNEQLEIIGEQGIGAFQQHINAVKVRYPKP